MGNKSLRHWQGVGALALAALSALSCSDQIEAKAGLLHELERLAFVPAGEVNSRILLKADFAAGTSVPLLVDRFEVTRSDLDNSGLEAPSERGWLGEKGWAGGSLEETGNWPACVSFPEAIEYAHSRGMRLPAVGEWLYIAAGRLGHRYPWGHTWQKSVANTLGLEFGRPLPVGTFEGGRGPFGTYDQIGNLWEWTSDWVPGIGDPFGEGVGLEDLGGEPPYLSALGGSFTSRQRPLFWDAESPLSFYAISLTRGHRSREVGMRCVAEAEGYLLRIAHDLGNSAVSQKRLRAIGARWASTGEGAVIELLERLVAQDASALGLKSLLEGARP